MLPRGRKRRDESKNDDLAKVPMLRSKRRRSDGEKLSAKEGGGLMKRKAETSLSENQSKNH